MLLSFLLPALALAGPFDSFVGTYRGYDGYWAHPFHTTVTVALQGDRPVMQAENLAQRSGCVARPGALLGLSSEGRKLIATYRLAKSAGCAIDDDTVRFVFDPQARGCSEWSPRITASFREGSWMGGTHHNIPQTHDVYWGLVKAGACN